MRQKLQFYKAGTTAVPVGILALVLGTTALSARAQDTRNVTEPVIPAACTLLQAQQAISNGEPVSETTFDTARIQAALNAVAATCGNGASVELTAGGTNNAFLIGPITLPTNVTLVIDGGVTVFGSRNPADYQVTTSGVETCGTVGTAGNGCNPLINATGANASIMGYGIIDGRGEDKLLVNGAPATYSWWDQAGTAQNVSGSQNNPILLQANAANLTLYKITFKNSPMFHVKWSGNITTRTGFTAWGLKVITPFTARNSDGIDPSGANILITNASISDGDDMVAVSASSAAQNITVQNTNTYSGHGISIGSYTQGGLNNMLVQNINQMGTAADGNGGGLRIKTSQDRGGLVQNVTYQNICSANVKSPIYISPYYNTNAGTSYPTISNILYRNIQVATEGTITLQGYSNTGGSVIDPVSITFDNVIIDTLKQTDFSPAPEYLNISIGPGPVSSLLTAQTGTGITYSGTVSNAAEAPYTCNPANFQYLVGELYSSTGNATNLKAATVTTNGTVTLSAMLQPAMSQVSYTSISGGGAYTGTAAPTAQVQFLEGTRVVGTASLGGNGTIASVSLSGLTAGIHTYTAYYAGDPNYTVPLSFGSVTVTVGAASASTTSLTATPTAVVYGASTALAASVQSSATGAPTGSVVFLDNSATVLTTAALASAAAQTSQVLGAGAHSLTAVYNGDANFAGSTSAAVLVTVTKATPSVALATSTPTVAFGSNATLTATIAPAGAGSYPTGTVTFYEGTNPVGAGTLTGAGVASTSFAPTGGAHTYTASYSGDMNYAAATSSANTAVAVAPASTTTTLIVSTNTAAGQPTTLQATITPGATGPVSPTGTITFLDGTTTIGSGTVSGNSVTSTALLAQGTHSITAKYSGDTSFAASTSAANPVVILAPFSITASPGTLSLAAGASGTTSVSVQPGGGFTGSVTLSCSSPVSYISCSITPTTSSVSGTTPISGTLTVQVAGTIARNQPAAPFGKRATWFALLLPLGALGLTRRRRLLRAMLPAVLFTAVLAAITGCSGGAPATLSSLPAAGTQVVTVTATSASASVSSTVNVMVTN